MKALAIVLVLACPALVGAQSHVYTKADLGKPRQWTHTLTADEMQSLLEHQYVWTPPLPDGPTVIIGRGYASDGPFGPLYLSPNWPPCCDVYQSYIGPSYGFGVRSFGVGAHVHGLSRAGDHRGAGARHGPHTRGR